MELGCQKKYWKKLKKLKNLNKYLAVIILIFSLVFCNVRLQKVYSQQQNPDSVVTIKTSNKPKYVRGIHLPPWVAGSKKRRVQIQELLAKTEINTIVIAVKEYQGEVYVPGIKLTEDLKTYVPAIQDIEEYLKELKQAGIYTVARIVVFRDNIVTRKKQSWAIKDINGNLWIDHSGMAWLDPYNRAVWEYIFIIAERCIDLGFDEIQFDYVRFPSDGNTKKCRYIQQHSETTAVQAIVEFLTEAKNRLKLKRSVNISVDVFGLTTSVPHDMGIGQNIVEMAKQVDFICPMIYPSHYAKGEYGFKDPNQQPYKIVSKSLKDAIKKLGIDAVKLRPYLQDFSLGYKYGKKEVLVQIQASYDNDIPEWTLWNPRGSYNHSAFKSKEFTDTYKKTIHE